MDLDTAASIVDALPALLKVADLAAVLSVPEAHVQAQYLAHRVPKPDSVTRRIPSWQLSSLRPWLIERLLSRDADIERARQPSQKAGARTGCGVANRHAWPRYPFLFIE